MLRGYMKPPDSICMRTAAVMNSKIEIVFNCWVSFSGVALIIYTRASPKSSPLLEAQPVDYGLKHWGNISYYSTLFGKCSQNNGPTSPVLIMGVNDNK
jgi:hypothetical protein